LDQRPELIRKELHKTKARRDAAVKGPTLGQPANDDARIRIWAFAADPEGEAAALGGRIVLIPRHTH